LGKKGNGRKYLQKEKKGGVPRKKQAWSFYRKKKNAPPPLKKKPPLLKELTLPKEGKSRPERKGRCCLAKGEKVSES